MAFAKRAVSWDMDTNVNRRMAYNHYFGPRRLRQRKAERFVGIANQPSGPASGWLIFKKDRVCRNCCLPIDKISTFVGKVFSWLIVSLTFLITWEVFSRYALNAPHAWAFDAMIMMYGGLFMMAGAYTLSKNGHVRGDVLYGFFPPRLQAGIDLTLYIVFFLPGVSPCAGPATSMPESPGRSGSIRASPLKARPSTPSSRHSRRRVFPADAGHRRNHPLHPLPEGRPVALAPGGRGGGRRGQAEGDDARQRRGYRQAR
jgi:hypothetical protein